MAETRTECSVTFTFSEATIKELVAYSLRGGNGWHITRNYMYKALSGKLAQYDDGNKQCAAISRSKSFGRILGLKMCKYIEVNYPKYNILNLNLRNDTFDFCVSDQVFEHIEGSPFVAFTETARIVKPGGYICHTTCFINNVHGAPKDFWRFTPDALALMASAAGCEVIETGGWGNREAWALIELGFRTAKIPEDPEHPLYKLAAKNEPSWPIVTWILARKPA